MSTLSCPGAATAWLELRPPEGWLRSGDAARRSARPPDGGLTLEWFPLEPLPRQQLAWARRVLAAGLAAGQAPSGRALTATETDAGWPLLLVEADLVGGAWAHRLCALYAFLEHGAVARLHADDAAAWARHATALRRILAAGAPDLGELVVSVEGFYDRRPGEW